jgi:hypothetical protein
LNAVPRNPSGCLIMQGALACGDAGDSIRQELVASLAAGEAVHRSQWKMVDVTGFEPATPCLQSRCSPS